MIKTFIEIFIHEDFPLLIIGKCSIIKLDFTNYR